MNRDTIFLLLVIAIAGLPACKNSKLSTNMVGSWKMSSYAADANGNKLMDEAEKHLTNTNITLNFFDNGKGTIFDGSHFIDSITWSIEPDNWLKQVDGTGKAWYYHIDSTSANRFVLRDTVEGTLWEILEKE